MSILGNLFQKKHNASKSVIYDGFEMAYLGDIFQIHENIFVRFTLEKQKIKNSDLIRFDQAIYNHVLIPVTNPDEVFTRSYSGALKYTKNEKFELGDITTNMHELRYDFISTENDDKDKRIFLFDVKKQYKKSKSFLNHRLLKEENDGNIVDGDLDSREKDNLILSNIDAVEKEYNAILNDRFSTLRLEIFTDKIHNGEGALANYRIIDFMNVVLDSEMKNSALLRALYINPVQYYLLKFLKERFSSPCNPFSKVTDRNIISKFDYAKIEKPKYITPKICNAFCAYNQFNAWFTPHKTYTSGEDKELKAAIFSTLRNMET